MDREYHQLGEMDYSSYINDTREYSSILWPPHSPYHHLTNTFHGGKKFKRKPRHTRPTFQKGWQLCSTVFWLAKLLLPTRYWVVTSLSKVLGFCEDRSCGLSGAKGRSWYGPKVLWLVVKLPMEKSIQIWSIYYSKTLSPHFIMHSLFVVAHIEAHQIFDGSYPKIYCFCFKKGDFKGIFINQGLQRAWDRGPGPWLKTETAVRAQDLGQAIYEQFHVVSRCVQLHFPGHW